MLCLSSADEQCTIMLPCCSSSRTAACLCGAWYCCYSGWPANSFCAHQTSVHAHSDANSGLGLETKALYEFAGMKGEEKLDRLLRHWKKANKGIMQRLSEEHNEICSLLSTPSSFKVLVKVDVTNGYFLCFPAEFGVTGCCNYCKAGAAHSWKNCYKRSSTMNV